MSLAKSTKCRPAKVSGRRSWSRARCLNRLSQPKLRSTTQRRGSSTKPFFASGSLMTCNSMPSSRADRPAQQCRPYSPGQQMQVSLFDRLRAESDVQARPNGHWDRGEERPQRVDQRHSNPWAAIASAAARGYVRCFIVQFQKPGQVSRANPVYPNFRRMRRTLTLNPVFRSTAPQTPVPSSPGTRERFLRPVRAPGVAGAGIAGSSPVPGTSGRHRDGETGIPVRVREGFTACLAVLGRFSGPWRGLAGRPTSAWCYFAPRAAHRPFYR
jgi:hypothetical protein